MALEYTRNNQNTRTNIAKQNMNTNILDDTLCLFSLISTGAWRQAKQ